jgi:hypothetical protein
MKKYYYIYQITNLVNNKYYVGVHKTSDLNDGYMGSGKVIKDAIKKYGIDNFKKDILEYFEDSESMYAREKEIVTDEFLLREDTYNLRRGGTGGFDFINKTMPKEQRCEISKLGGNTRHITKEDLSNRIKESKRNNPTRLNGSKRVQELYPEGTRKGSKNTDAHNKKIGLANSIKQSGTRNSQYGIKFKWMTKNGVNKKVQYDEVQSYLDDGWVFGCKPKN